MNKNTRILVILSCLMLLPFFSYAQNESTQDLEAYFSAIIVSDLDSSINWYSTSLGFEVVNKVESTERGFKQSNLKRGSTLLELIELDRAVSLKDTVSNYSDKMRFIGFFKIGFLVSDFDKWIDRLTGNNVDFYGNVVTDNSSGKRMVIITDPDYNRIQIFEK
ncbi:MAG: VOC family protein [Calditrichia bacterium]